MRTAYLGHPACLLHETGEHHPEHAGRIRAIDDRLIAAGLMDLLRIEEADRATHAQLRRVHDTSYVADLTARPPDQGIGMLDPDTPFGPHSLEAALRAAGAGIQAVDMMMTGEVDNAFCAVRPPGHHAERNHAMGFCLFNNVAVAAAHALHAHGLKRVAILDFDAHHGNGTEDIFAGDERVLFCSTFQHPFYPYTDVATSPANCIRAPLSAGSDGAAFSEAVESLWLPAIERFGPEMILVSAGFDGHIEDDMAHLRLVDSDFAWITGQIVALAARHAGGRIVSMLEGGYALDALGRSAALHIRGLMGV